MKKAYLFLIIVMVTLVVKAQHQNDVDKLANDLKSKGEDPLNFVHQIFKNHDLIVFDDALHSAYEPFIFYNQLLNDKALEGRLNYIFLEIIGTNDQPIVNQFLNSKTKDTTLLRKIFQDDYSGNGLQYQTYLDLFTNVWEHNKNLSDSLKIQVIGVDPPIYWESIKTWRDYEIFQNTLKSRDYFMYLEILEKMKNFSENKKGIFLTNTRHAYKNIKDAEGNIYWNTTTFFTHWNPGKVYSIRLHNVNLQIEAKKVEAEGAKKSTEGLDAAIYKWVKIDNGSWDNAFAANGNKSVAISFNNTTFGKTKYTGNHMLNVAKNTTMLDAYDALIFLKPIEELHFSAKFDFIYTPEFGVELERRLKLLKGEDYNKFLQDAGAATFQEYYKSIKPVAISKNMLIK